MRWSILRTLLHKELLRHLANRGGVVLILLLLVAAMLLSFVGDRKPGQNGLFPGLSRCYVDFAEESPLVAHLRAHVPDDLRPQVRFRPLHQARTDPAGKLLYPPNAGAIQLRPPVITRQAPVGGHARLVAHALYGDHTRAEELRRLNSWGRSLLIERGEEMQAYAR